MTLTTYRLRRPKKHEIVEIGTGVQAQLDEQAHTLQSAERKVHEATNLAGDARHELRAIEVAEWKQRVLSVGAVVVVVLSVSIAVFLMLF